MIWLPQRAEGLISPALDYSIAVASISEDKTSNVRNPASTPGESCPGNRRTKLTMAAKAAGGFMKKNLCLLMVFTGSTLALGAVELLGEALGLVLLVLGVHFYNRFNNDCPN